MDLTSIAIERDGVFQTEESASIPVLHSPAAVNTETIKAECDRF
jgi:hypothetical protein